MSGDLRVLNRQRTRSVDTRLLREILLHSLGETDFDLTIQLVDPAEMARLNEKHLGHTGSTDVITLDFANDPEAPPAGEIFICLADAIEQAREFRTTWQSELVRYAIHGILHLQGYDDLKPTARRKMKAIENRRLKALAAKFPLKRLEAKPGRAR